MLQYRIDQARRFVEVVGVQTPDPEEFARLFAAILADPDYRPGYGFYRDRRGMVPMKRGTLQANLAVVAALPGLTGSRWAYVVSDPANYGMARMAAILGDGSALELQIFETPEAALAWLAERPQDSPALAPLG
ncbi:MAG: hypothetical protein IT352_15550 [Gemmatimonadales bacterium]|nr:hypothetical protein [Gemmatimonadales bacterium]